jgi:hypothetical protein
LNWLFFGFIVVGSLLVQAGFAEVYSWPFGEVLPVNADNALFLFGFIFVNNLVLSSFLVVTLTGFVFFGLGVAFLCFRGLLWGVLFSGLSTPMFLAVLPTLILEGEGYVLAAMAGVVLGLSWIRPSWVYRGEGLPRSEAVKRALGECTRIYVLVALILLVAALVETATVVFI